MVYVGVLVFGLLDIMNVSKIYNYVVYIIVFFWGGGSGIVVNEVLWYYEYKIYNYVVYSIGFFWGGGSLVVLSCVGFKNYGMWFL